MQGRTQKLALSPVEGSARERSERAWSALTLKMLQPAFLTTEVPLTFALSRKFMSKQGISP
jgi:hypothetical protein